jgi:hypothetical protein
MAASGRQIVTWVVLAGFTGPDRVTAVALAHAAGSDPAKPGGLWGVGGAAGDGQSQANAAYASFKANGFAGFPAHRGAAWLLFVPLASAELAQWAGGVVVSNPGAAAAQVGPAAVSAAAPAAVSGPLQEAGAAINFLTQPITWQRVSKIIIGGGLVLIASLRLAYRTGYKPIDNRIVRALTEFDRGVAVHGASTGGATVRHIHTTAPAAGGTP